jgi:hypothetical protein
MKELAATAAILASTGSTLAQPFFTTDSTVTLSMAWSDNGLANGNNNGQLDPGEAALITMTLSFTNQGGPAHFEPPVLGHTSGTIAFFASAFINIDGSGGTDGLFNNSTPLANSAGTSG